VTVVDDEAIEACLPTVTIQATDWWASEVSNTDTAAFRVSRTEDASEPLIVGLAVSGTATPLVDYNGLPNFDPDHQQAWVGIPTGQAYAALTIAAIDDAAYEGSESVTLTVVADPNYGVGYPDSATATIWDDDNVVSVEAVDSLASEDPTTDTAVFHFSRT